MIVKAKPLTARELVGKISELVDCVGAEMGTLRVPRRSPRFRFLARKLEKYARLLVGKVSPLALGRPRR